MKAAIWRYVNQYNEIDGETHVSTFRAALRDARQLAGRNLDSGVIEGKAVAVWPYAHMYLILMDQVGKVIMPASSTRTTPSNDLRTALEEFDSGLDERDRDMLCAPTLPVDEFGEMANKNAIPEPFSTDSPCTRRAKEPSSSTTATGTATTAPPRRVGRPP